MKISIGSLFSGIGGLELGLEWAGLGPVKWQVENDEFCSKVLAKHWPNSKRYADVRDVGAHNLEPVDLVCGGFPCQPHSTAGRRSGRRDDRWLWPEFARVLGEMRPRFAVIENVPGLLTSDGGEAFRDVLRSLAALGYDAWWDRLRAADVGAPHERERLFVVAWLADTHGARLEEWIREPENACTELPSIERGSTNLCARTAQSIMGMRAHGVPSGLDGGWPVRPGESQHGQEPARTAIGIENRAAKIKALGNAVVPQCAYVIGRVVIAIDQSSGNVGPNR